MKNHETRLKKLEQRLKPGPLPVVIIDEGEPVPPEAGPDTVVIIDDVPRVKHAKPSSAN